MNSDTGHLAARTCLAINDPAEGAVVDGPEGSGEVCYANAFPEAIGRARARETETASVTG